MNIFDLPVIIPVLATAYLLFVYIALCLVQESS